MRNGPRRSSAGVASADGNGASGPAAAISAAMDSSLRTAQLFVDTADAVVRGTVERGVDTAYTVIEEYMLRGQDAARRFQERTTRSDPMNERRPNDTDWAAQWGPMSPMMAPWMQMMRMWTENMSAIMPGMPTDWMNMYTPGTTAAGRLARSNVSVRIDAAAPAEVSIELDVGAEFARLTAEPLVQAASRTAAPIDGVSLECDSGHVRVRVTVPARQPAGTYTGAIHDSTGTKRGELTVHLEARLRKRPPRKTA